MTAQRTMTTARTYAWAARAKIPILGLLILFLGTARRQFALSTLVLTAGLIGGCASTPDNCYFDGLSMVCPLSYREVVRDEFAELRRALDELQATTP